MVANYTLQWLGQKDIPLIWKKVDWKCQATFSYFVKWKNPSSNERKDIGRGAEVWEAKERSRGRKKKNSKLKKEN